MKPTFKKTVQKMRDEYEKSIRKSSTENLKKKYADRPWLEEAKSTWISRQDLEAFLDANNADGLRIYYGCHHMSTNSDPKLDYLGLHNLIFVATKSTSGAPTSETSTDQLVDSTEEPTTFEGAALSDTILCPPICPPPPPPPPPANQ